MKVPPLVAALVALASAGAFAQSGSDSATGFVDRNVNQQQRIEQGLESGALNTREAAHLERAESRIENMESKAMRDGKVTAGEARRIDAAQDRVSRDIYREKHDAQRGNPDSASSQRMQADVQRNVSQQQRIGQGLQSGSLTTREAGRLERGESRINRMEARAGANGNVGRLEQQRLQRAENRQSGRIFGEKHDAQRRPGASGDRSGGNRYPQAGNSNRHGQHGGRHTIARR